MNIKHVYPSFFCRWRRPSIMTRSRLRCCNNLANKSDSSELFRIYQTVLMPRWELDPNKRQTDHLAKHSVKSFITLMSSYCTLQEDTQLITLRPSQAASSNHFRHAIYILKMNNYKPSKEGMLPASIYLKCSFSAMYWEWLWASTTPNLGSVAVNWVVFAIFGFAMVD